MTYIATITSKRQLTIPAELFRKAGFSSGQKVLIDLNEGDLSIKSAFDLIDELEGSVSLPKKIKGKDIDGLITRAKVNHFKKKYKDV